MSVSQKILDRFMKVAKSAKEREAKAKASLPKTRLDSDLENFVDDPAPTKKNVPDSLKEEVFSAPTKGGGKFVVTKRDSSKSNSSQDGFEMHVHDKDGNKTSHGTHASLDGAKKYYANRLKEDITDMLNPHDKARAGKEYEHMDAEALGRKHGKAGSPPQSPYKKGTTMHGDYMRGHYNASRRSEMHEESHFSNGLFDGTNGKDYNNPHAEGSKEHKHYHMGHEIGSAKRAKTNGAPPKVPRLSEGLVSSFNKMFFGPKTGPGVINAEYKKGLKHGEWVKQNVKDPETLMRVKNDMARGKGNPYKTSGVGMGLDNEYADFKRGWDAAWTVTESAKKIDKAIKDAYRAKHVVASIDKDAYPPIKGLEGPFRKGKAGHVLYYDPKEGKYYNSKSDMYIDHDEAKEMGLYESNDVVLKRNVSTLLKHVGGKVSAPAGETPAAAAYRMGKEHKAAGKPHANPHSSDTFEHDQYNNGYGH